MTEEAARPEEQPIGAVVQSSSTAVAKTDHMRAIAEVQAAMVIARQNPRNPIAAMDRVLNACQRPGLAMAALYSYARGGSEISGPSIRLAEAVAQNWGNIQFGIRELEQGERESTVQAFAWDVETNTRREVTFHVPHYRYTKKDGLKRLTDPRDIYEMVANQGARRLRACILGIVPGDVTEGAVAQCEETLKASADTSPENVRKLVATLAEFGVTKEMIEKRIQRRLDSIQPAQVISLRKIWASLRDEMSKPEDWFEVPDDPGGNGKTQTEKLKETLAAGDTTDSGLTIEQGEHIERIGEILTTLAGTNSKKAASLLTSWSGAKVAALTSLPEHPDLILTVLDRAEATLTEHQQAAAEKQGKIV